MTFLLFLASVAVLEYLVRDVRTPADRLHAPEIPSLKGDEAISNETAASDLLALSQALGSAARPQTVELEKASKEAHR